MCLNQKYTAYILISRLSFFFNFTKNKKGFLRFSFKLSTTSIA